ncbi:hypothetical protein [Pseudomonas yamanorum]|uniref:hypothetical protein n=1 Tax=Pseudomonas yamanorum TaxID=515393 RepID=UPI003F752A22
MLISAGAIWYVWMLLCARYELGGTHLDVQTLGTIQNIDQRAMVQYCTGVVVTPQGTWLVGRIEARMQHLKLPSDAVDLDAIVLGKPNAQEQKSSYDDKEISIISRLDTNGQFRVVAHVGEAACLVASPDGASVNLLTGVKRPKEEDTHNDAVEQTVVYRSRDQGKSWSWAREGFFPEAEWIAWNLKLYFHNNDEVWAWGRPHESGDSAKDIDGSISTGVFYSANGGISSTPITAGKSLLVTAQYAHDKRPEIMEWFDNSGPNGEIKTHVTQLDAHRASIWVSQRFWGSAPNSADRRLAFNVTTRADLHKDGELWRVASQQRDDGVFIDAVVENASGRVIGLMHQDNQSRAVIAQLDTNALTWQALGELPSVFSPLPSDTMLRERNFWVGQNTLVINTSSEHYPPRWLYWWSDAQVSGDGVFYSKDWGRSWQQLAIDGYLGTLGFQGEQDRVIWGKGNTYNSNDLGIYWYGLKGQ